MPGFSCVVLRNGHDDNCPLLSVSLHSALALKSVMDNNSIILISHKQEAPLTEG